MALSFTSSQSAIMRDDFDRAFPDLTYGGQYGAIFGLMNQVEKSGDAVRVPLALDYSIGVGINAVDSLNSATNSTNIAFIVTPYREYATSKIDLGAAVFATGDEQSVVDYLEDQAEKVANQAKFLLDQALCRSGYGEVGTIASSTGSGPTYVLTFSQRSDMLGLILNGVYVSKATTTTASLDAGSFTINSINAQALTASVTAANSWAPTNTHVIGQINVMAASASPVLWPGILGWIPPFDARPLSSGDSFFQVNRSNDEMKLAGVAIDGTTLEIAEAVEQLAYAIADVPGANPDTVICTFNAKGRLVSSLQTQKRYVDEGGKAKAGRGDIEVFYDTVKIMGPTGPMDIVCSSNWQSNQIAVLTRASWFIGSPKNKPIQPSGMDNLPFQNLPGQDTAVSQYRIDAFCWCNAPGRNGIAKIAAK